MVTLSKLETGQGEIYTYVCLTLKSVFKNAKQRYQKLTNLKTLLPAPFLYSMLLIASSLHENRTSHNAHKSSLPLECAVKMCVSHFHSEDSSTDFA